MPRNHEALLQWRRERRAIHRAAGKCHCGKEPIPGRLTCLACIHNRSKKQKERNTKMAALRREKGLCVSCGGLKVPGQSCEVCRPRRNKSYRNLKVQVIEAYGGKCECCGEGERAFLTIDHINNNGGEHRKDLKRQGTMIYTWLRRHGFPKDNYRLMCLNCNLGRQANGGMCPHEMRRKKKATKGEPPTQPSLF